MAQMMIKNFNNKTSTIDLEEINTYRDLKRSIFAKLCNYIRDEDGSSKPMKI
jgi:hypothetical protein